MASSIQYYQVTITNPNGSPLSAPNNGFVDATSIESYVASTAYALEMTSNTNLTYALSQAKKRANFRWHEILRQIQLIANIAVDPNAIVATGGTALAEPTSFVFQVVALFGATSLSTIDETNTAVTLTGANCLKRCIARALVADQFREAVIFDPTATTSAGNSNSNVVRYGSRIVPATSNAANQYATPFEIGPIIANATVSTAGISSAISIITLP